MRTRLAIVPLLFSMLSAQNIVYHDDPNPTTGGLNYFPFGSEGVRTQQVIPNSVFGMTPAFINDLYVNPLILNTNPSIASSLVYYGDFEIRMGTTQLTQLTTTWANNITNPVTVYRGPMLINFIKDQWIPLGLQQSYLWLPTSTSDNLVIDCICWDVIDTGAVTPTGNGFFLQMRRSPSNSISRAFLNGWTTNQPATAQNVDGFGIKHGFLLNDGTFVAHEGQCSGSSALTPAIGAAPPAWPVAGQPFDFELTNGPVNSFALVAFGLEHVNYLGFPLPFDMGLLGATGCSFWHGWELLHTPVFTDAAGAATSTLTFPGVVPAHTRLYATWLCFDPTANAFGFVPSGYATLIF